MFFTHIIDKLYLWNSSSSAILMLLHNVFFRQGSFSQKPVEKWMFILFILRDEQNSALLNHIFRLRKNHSKLYQGVSTRSTLLRVCLKCERGRDVY